MKSSKAARRYASALLEISAAENNTSELLNEFRQLSESLDVSPELLRLFTSPVISNLKKQSIIESLFKDKLSPLSMRFLTTLVRKNREVLIREVIFALEELYNIKNSIAIADVSSARAMSMDEQSQLVSALEKKTGFTIKAHWNVDEALIGGLKVQIKDRIYDGSVSYKIDRLTQAFSSPN